MSVGWIVLVVLLIAAGAGVWFVRRKPAVPPLVDDPYSDDDTAWRDPIHPSHPDQHEPRP
jgi:hypothetical protein